MAKFFLQVGCCPSRWINGIKVVKIPKGSDHFCTTSHVPTFSAITTACRCIRQTTIHVCISTLQVITSFILIRQVAPGLMFFFVIFFPARTVCSSKQSGKYSAWTSTITEIGKNSTRKGRSWKIMYTKVHNNQYTRCFLCPRKMIQNLHSLLRWVPATTDCLRRHLPTWLRSIQSN